MNDVISLNVQTGQLVPNSGPAVTLNERTLAVLYFAALGAPDAYCAAQLGIDTAAVEDERRSLARSLGVAAGDLEGLALEVTNGDWPHSAVPWADRHGAALITRGLDRPADDILLYVAGEGALSVGEVRSLVNQLRAGLAAEGIGKGSRVALDASQRAESFLLALALLLEGAVIVRLGDNLGPDTLHGMVAAAPVQMSFTAHGALLSGLSNAGKIVALDPGTGGQPFAEWTEAFADQAENLRPPAKIAPGDVALIGFTSGSTGLPKLVQNTHMAIFRSTEIAVRRFGLGPSDVFMTATDFVALSGFRSMLALPLMSGGRVVFPSAEARVTPLAQALECEEYGVTCLTAVPNVLRGFVAAEERLSPGPHPTLRLVLSGSGVLDAPTAQAFTARFGAPVVDYYGKRELGTPVYTDPKQPTTMNTGGGLAAEALVRVLDDAGHPVPDDAPGEIVVLTDSGEAREPGAGPAWHRTGDLGKLKDGRIVITGRKSDIIKTPDGQLLSPIEVESILTQNASVTEAVVFPYLRSDGSERVGAAVLCPSPEDGLEETLRWAVRDALGAYKTPDHILVTGEFPRVGRNKPDKTGILSMFRAAFVPNFDPGTAGGTE